MQSGYSGRSRHARLYSALGNRSGLKSRPDGFQSAPLDNVPGLADVSRAHAPGRVAAVVQLLLIALAAGAGNYARYALGPLQESVRIALGLDDNQLAILQGPVLALPLVILSIPLGLAIDRYSRARLLHLVAVVITAGSLLTALASSFALMLMARALVGLVALAIPAIALSLIADRFPSSQRGRAVMIMTMGQLGGMAAVFALGGEFLTRFGAGSSVWSSAMLWLTAPLAAAACLMLLIRDASRHSKASERARTSAVWSEVWRHRSTVGPLLAALVLMELVACAAVVWTTPALSRRFAVPPDRVGAALAMGIMVSGLVGPIVGGFLADACQRWGGPYRSVSVMAALTMLNSIAATFPILPEWGEAATVFVCFLTVTTAILGMGTAVYTVIVPEHVRGVFSSILNGGGIIAFGLAPVLVSGLSSLMGGPLKIAHSLMAVGGTSGLLGTALLAVAARRFFRMRPIGGTIL